MTRPLLLGLLGTGVGAGILLIWHALTPSRLPSERSRSRLAVAVTSLRHRNRRMLVIAVATGVAVGIATGWFVAGILTAMAIAGFPILLGRKAVQRNYLARIEAIATWTEMLRDTLVAAAGLEQAILATAPIAPGAIAAEIRELAVRIDRGDKLTTSLRLLADSLRDPTADLVIAALVLAADHHARQLADLLGELAGQAREEASMRVRVEAQRARSRTSVRVIVLTTTAFASGLVAFNRPYLAPFDGPVGQLVLASVGGLFVIAFVWLERISRYDLAERVLTEPGSIATNEEAWS